MQSSRAAEPEVGVACTQGRRKIGKALCRVVAICNSRCYTRRVSRPRQWAYTIDIFIEIDVCLEWIFRGYTDLGVFSISIMGILT